MQYGNDPERRRLIGQVVAQARRKQRGRKDGPAARRAETAVRALYANVALDDLEDIAPSDLAGAGLARLGFAASRKPGQPKLRAYTPQEKRDGWSADCDVVEIVNDDMPFLVDSITAELDRLGVTVLLVLHPVLEVARDGNGRLQALGAQAERPAARNESWMQLRITHQYDKDRLREITAGLERVLRDVRLAVTDWRKMLARANEAIAELEDEPPPVDDAEIRESVDFLNWLVDNHFTFLGYREYRLVEGGTRYELVERSGLGLLRGRDVRVFHGLSDEDELPPDVQAHIRQPELVMINKANHRSTVHRPVQLDTIGVKRYGDDGSIVGERRFVGLFTSSAYSQRPQQIPLLRKKVRRMIERAGFDPRSHDGKVLIHVLDHFPRDELFQIGEDDLFEISLGILQLQERHRVALFLRADPFERFISAQVFAPRERYDTRLRMRFGRILEQALDGQITSFQTQIADDSALARVQFIIATTPGAIPKHDRQEIETRLAEAARTWTDALTEVLVEVHGEARGAEIVKRYANAFPTAYTEDHTAGDGVFDIAMIEAVAAAGQLDSHLYRIAGQAAHELCLKIYHPGEPLPLADMMPVLEHMGLRAISEVPYEVDIDDDDGPVWLHTFSLCSETGNAIDIEAVEPLFREALRHIFAGELENDGFNRLVLAPGLDWREVAVLRAYAKYLRQARIRFSQDYLEETLGCHADIARALVDLFHARFDPELDSNRAQRVAGLTGGIRRMLDEVRSADEDAILSRFLNAISASLRTNHYQNDAQGRPKSYISIKLDSRAVEGLPLPRPMFEIFVYSPRFEGIHLRGGKVARGGLRWSDRREDFRTEILGLMKAQMVKNAVIVPVGSKGGFVLKQPPPSSAGREALQEEGIACYKLFISGLLDITDNLDGAKVVPPKQVQRYDDDDPYLVVAADKGTATFSDIANGVAGDYGFWLDDAFASGGSAGYDHKAMGITARGAWESVKRHFRELDHDTQRAPFTVFGVGDMSGDVFGNGMLQSKHIRLIGAFNHLHVFIDPDPDPETSFKERKRLFGLARSSWDDYDRRLISRGGGVFERSAKSIRLTPQMRDLLGLAGDRATPNEVIRALLKVEADLLWFGGIGTYVRAADESDIDVGDRANDAIRITGEELRCKVIGEGANLGMTQRARIEAALEGVKLNTDAIDNSAGVDCSDHEVNIKILLGQVERGGKLKRPARNRLLAKMTDEVAELVLRDNYAQSMAISVEEVQAHRILDRHVRLMRRYERADRLNRRVEYLPDDEALEERRGRGRGLTRPELAVLLAYAKINFYADVLESDLPDETALADALVGYFPQPLQDSYAAQIRNHRLKREIAATWITNSMINRAGSTFVTELQEDTGASAEMIARAYFITRDAYALRPLWDRIEALDNKVPASAQTGMLQAIRRLINRVTLWFLRYGGEMRDLAGTAKRLGDCVTALGDNFEKVLPTGDRGRLERRMARYTGDGVPEALARDIAMLEDLAAACDVERLAGRYRRDVTEVARLYFALGNRFGLEWLREGARRLPADSPWEIRAITSALEDLDGDQRELTATVLADGAGRSGGKSGGGGNGKLAPDAVIEDWVAHNGGAVERIDSLLSELRAVGGLDIAMLTVAGRELKMMIPQ